MSLYLMAVALLPNSAIGVYVTLVSILLVMIAVGAWLFAEPDEG